MSDFNSITEREFAFLTEDYGFLCVKSSSSCVRFESENVFVAVQYDAARSYELGVEIGQLRTLYSGKERPFNLMEVLKLDGVDQKEDLTNFQTNKPALLAKFISRLAFLLSKYAVEYIENNRFSFKRLGDYREKECDKYEMERKLVHVRNEAVNAWKRKEYSEVVRLYKPVRDSLSNSEKKKLEFAEKQV